MSKRKWQLLSVVLVVAFFALSGVIQAQISLTFRARDPGVRGGDPGAGGAIPGLSGDEGEMFVAGLADFSEEETVDDGVGPRFNFVGCKGCHIQPAVGGTSPAVNPLFRVPSTVAPDGLRFTGNVIPSFIRLDGPIREARFQFNNDGSRDGGVHALFVITGHPDAPGCNIQQEDFERQVRNNNIIFRIPTPTFGAGLIEQITDSAILANKALEVIEAHYLFGLPYDRIEVVVHPQSVVHSFVEFTDGSIIAQLGTADMRQPA